MKIRRTPAPTSGRLMTLAGCLCISLPALAQTPSTSSVEVFGDLSIGLTRQTGTTAPRYQETSSSAWANSLGFRGREDLGDGTQAIFAIVTSPGLDVGTSGTAAAFWKNAYVGLSNPAWGTLMLGRNDELMVTLCGLDVMCLRGVIQGLRPGNIDRVGGAQLSNMVRYNSPDLGPFRFKAYITAGEGATAPNGKAYGIQADYRQGSLMVGAAHENIKFGSITPGSPFTGIGVTSFFGNPSGPATAFNLGETRLDGLGARYGMGPITVFGLVTRTGFQFGGQTKSLKAYNFGAAYDLNAPLEFAAGCSRITFDPSSWTTCQARVTYNFSKRTSVYLADVHQKADGAFAQPQLFLAGGTGSLGGSTNLIGAGIRHTF